MNKSQNSETVTQNNQFPFILSPSLQSPLYPINSKLHQKIPQETPLSTKGNVKSFCRIRPNYTQFSSLDRFKLENNNKTLIVDFTSDQDKNNPSKQYIYKYNFTEIFWTNIKNDEIYEKVCKSSIKELFTQHKNALIFVYGITSSGKTYTVNGNMETPGILQKSLLDLYKEYDKLKENNSLWNLTCTYIEIYNEEVFDLLSKERKKIKIVGRGNKFYAQGCITKTINSVQDFSNALSFGELNRTKAETNANPYSSRSHSIFRVELSYQNNDNISLIEPVSLCIVDLAGAERVSKSGVIGTGLKEAGNINSSLLVLKKCFDAMEANSRTNVVEKKIIVPVRESKLTMLFKEYFAAHQNISVICTINPDKNEMMDIRSVLNFGAKAMKVKPVKSWIPVYNNYNNSSSREVSPNKKGSRDNFPFRKDYNNINKKKYRLLTEKKYIEKNNNLSSNNNSKNASKENIFKAKEDPYINNSNSNNNELYSKKKSPNNIMYTSNEKLQNIKLSSQKKYNHYYNQRENSPDKFKDNNNILTLHNIKIIPKEEKEKEKITKENYDQRIKCFSNPFDIVSIKENNFFMKNSPSEEMLKLEKELKEKKNKEIKEKITKHKEDIKNTFIDIFIKKLYYKNLEDNINIYEKQCNNIDLKEVETLLNNNSHCANNNFFSLKNPFINDNNNVEEENEKNKLNNLSKTHQIDFTYLNKVIKKVTELKNENNINISYKPEIIDKKNEIRNFQISNNYTFGYLPENNNKNNEFDIFRGNKEFIEELQIKLNNNEHDQSKILEFLDKSFEQYNASQFKAYFGIGNSLVKRLNKDNANNDNNNKNKKNNIIDKAENDANINFNINEFGDNDVDNNRDKNALDIDEDDRNDDDIFSSYNNHEFNFKRKGKEKYSNIKNIDNNIIKESSKENIKYINNIKTIKNKKYPEEEKITLDSKNDIDSEQSDKEKEKKKNKGKKTKDKSNNKNKSKRQKNKKKGKKKNNEDECDSDEDKEIKEEKINIDKDEDEDEEENQEKKREKEEKKEKEEIEEDKISKENNEEEEEEEIIKSKKSRKRKKASKKGKSKSKPKTQENKKRKKTKNKSKDKSKNKSKKRKQKNISEAEDEDSFENKDNYNEEEEKNESINNDIDINDIDDEEIEKELLKAKNTKKRKNRKKKIVEITSDSNDDISDEDENIKPAKVKRRKRNKRSKKYS